MSEELKVSYDGFAQSCPYRVQDDCRSKVFCNDKSCDIRAKYPDEINDGWTDLLIQLPPEGKQFLFKDEDGLFAVAVREGENYHAGFSFKFNPTHWKNI